MTTPSEATTEPAADRGVVDLTAQGATLLAQARDASSGRAATNLMPATGAVLTQTMLALRAGAELTDHTSPGPATLHVLTGRATLVSGGTTVTVGAGEWVPIPREEHRVEADEDVVALLTVAVQDPEGE